MLFVAKTASLCPFVSRIFMASCFLNSAGAITDLLKDDISMDELVVIYSGSSIGSSVSSRINALM